MKLIILAISFFSSLTALASGVVVGDGGHAIICIKPGLFGREPHAYLLDMVEAKNITKAEAELDEPYRGITYTFEPYFEMYVNDVLKHAIEVIGRSHPFIQVISNAKNVYDGIAFFSKDQFQLSGVLGPIFAEIPAGCELTQIGVYVQENGVEEIMLNEDGFLTLDWRDRSLLLIHETLHAWFKGEGNSLPVRQAIWYLTANGNFRAKNKDAFIRLITEKKPQQFEP